MRASARGKIAAYGEDDVGRGTAVVSKFGDPRDFRQICLKALCCPRRFKTVLCTSSLRTLRQRPSCIGDLTWNDIDLQLIERASSVSRSNTKSGLSR